ncbi:MAG: response regulator [Bacteroidales bacterium]|nr:response regulator [Bacteroidales bacterium]
MKNEAGDNKNKGHSEEDHGKEEKRKQILIVEDDKPSRLYYHELIRIMKSLAAKISVQYVSSGEEAVDYCRKNAVDLVFMDVKLPGMNGWEAARRIKAEDPQISIIAQTAYSVSGNYYKSLEAGCDAYLSKPVTSEEFIETLQKYLQM